MRILEFDTDTLFSVAEPLIQEIDFELLPRVTKEVPLYAFDLNAYLEPARNRAQFEDSLRLFGAALTHQFKLRIASELVVELQRIAFNAPSRHPFLQLVLQLLKITSADKSSLVARSQQLLDLVFSHRLEEKPSTSQSRSNARQKRKYYITSRQITSRLVLK